MNDYSLSAKLPSLPEVTTLTKLRDSLDVFYLFALEFYNQATQELVKAACDFAMTLPRIPAWQPTDIEKIVD